MNDEFDETIKCVQRLIELFDDNSADKHAVAKELQFKLSVLKLLVGIHNFEELPAFSRYLRLSTEYINKIDKAK